MHEVTFQLAGTSEYATLTADFDARIALWCTGQGDLLRVRCRPAVSDAIEERVASFAGVDDAVANGGDLVLVTETCVNDLEAPTVDPYLDAHGCLLLEPLQYEAGARHCRVLALEAERLTHLYRSLLDSFDVVVKSKRELPPIDGRPPFGLESTLPSLTRRQRQVFAIAHERGYYELPRETTMEAIAADLGIDRRTAEEHRRLAERKLLGALVDHYLT